MADKVADAIQLARLRAAKIAHLLEIGLDCFSILDPVTEHDRQLLEAVAVMIAHEQARRVVSGCCDPFETVMVQQLDEEG